MPHDVSASSRSRKRPKPKPPIPDAGPLDPAAALRYERLKTVRLELARANKQVAFWVAHDSVLRELARSAPQTLDALGQIKGIGPQKLEAFGEALLKAVKEAKPL
jgi:superfamily II DNA helicase RecQ